MPKEQKEFLREIIEAQQLSSGAANDMQRGGIKNKRDKRICQILKALKVKDWIGQVDTISANSDGKGVISILIGDKIWVKTWNNEYSDMRDATLVSPESKLFMEASNLREEQLVIFSGTFIRPEFGEDCVREGSLSLSGKVEEPEFIFRFSSVGSLVTE